MGYSPFTPMAYPGMSGMYGGQSPFNTPYPQGGYGMQSGYGNGYGSQSQQNNPWAVGGGMFNPGALDFSGAMGGMQSAFGQQQPPWMQGGMGGGMGGMSYGGIGGGPGSQAFNNFQGVMNTMYGGGQSGQNGQRIGYGQGQGMGGRMQPGGPNGMMRPRVDQFGSPQNYQTMPYQVSPLQQPTTDPTAANYGAQQGGNLGLPQSAPAAPVGNALSGPYGIFGSAANMTNTGAPGIFDPSTLALLGLR